MTFLVVRALPKGSDMGPIDTVFSTKGALRIPLTYDKHLIPSRYQSIPTEPMNELIKPV